MGITKPILNSRLPDFREKDIKIELQTNWKVNNVSLQQFVTKWLLLLKEAYLYINRQSLVKKPTRKYVPT